MHRKSTAANVDKEAVAGLDRVVEKRTFPNRSRLARECAKLDPVLEKALAEEGMAIDESAWPKY